MKHPQPPLRCHPDGPGGAVFDGSGRYLCHLMSRDAAPGAAYALTQYLVTCANALARHEIDPEQLTWECRWAQWAVALIKSRGDPAALAALADEIQEVIGHTTRYYPTLASVSMSPLARRVCDR